MTKTHSTSCRRACIIVERTDKYNTLYNTFIVLVAQTPSKTYKNNYKKWDNTTVLEIKTKIKK